MLVAGAFGPFLNESSGLMSNIEQAPARTGFVSRYLWIIVGDVARIAFWASAGRFIVRAADQGFLPSWLTLATLPAALMMLLAVVAVCETLVCGFRDWRRGVQGFAKMRVAERPWRALVDDVAGVLVVLGVAACLSAPPGHNGVPSWVVVGWVLSIGFLGLYGWMLTKSGRRVYWRYCAARSRRQREARQSR